MKRRSRRVFRRHAPTAWMASPDTYNPAVLITVPGNTLDLTQIIQSPFGALTRQPTVDRFTVLRIVGDINWRFNSNAGAASSVWNVSAGIYLADEAQGALEAKNPSIGGGLASTDAEAGWLWLRHAIFSSQSTTEDVTTTGLGWDRWHLDIRVKRILRPKQALVFACFGQAILNAAAILQRQTALRTLISRTA